MTDFKAQFQALHSSRKMPQHTIAWHDALMRPNEITFYADGATCMVDAEAVVGLCGQSDTAVQPWLTTSYPLGEFILHMLEQGIRQICIGIGDTANIDAGIGLLQALGTRFTDAEGEPLGPHPLRACDLSLVYSADFSAVPRQRLLQALTIVMDAATDMPLIPASDAPSENSLLSLATRQGLPTEDVPKLHAALKNYTAAIDNALHTPRVAPPFQGAGGGLGYAFSRVLKCRCMPVAEH